jgi:hypothetical protein|tara:strand:- start:3242 stop:4189 length:948 start_codon:yes stop_codon:yes gene_type:complete
MVVFFPAKLTIFLKNMIKYGYKLIKWLLFPIFWTYQRKMSYIRFAFKKSENRTLNVQERWFIEQIPIIHAATGLIIGFLVSIFTVSNLYNWIKTTIEDTWTFTVNLFQDFWSTMQELWITVTDWIVDNILWVYLNIEEFFAMLKETFIIAFSINPYTTLGGLLMIGIGLNVLYIIIQERLYFTFLRWMRYIFRTPDFVRVGIQQKYRSYNHKIMIFLINFERLKKRNVKFFRRAVLYTFAMSIYSLAASITIALEPGFLETLNYTFVQIIYVTSIVFIGEVVSGSVFFPIAVRLLDFFGGKTYMAKENAEFDLEN